MAKANTGSKGLPTGDRSWKFCTRCQSNVRSLDNHSKPDGNGGMTPCK